MCGGCCCAQMFRVCLHCDQVKTVESYHRQKPPRTSDTYKYCKECYPQVKIAKRRDYYARREALVQHNWQYQQEDPKQCTRCMATRSTKHFSTQVEDGTKFSDICVFCDLRTCKECDKVIPLYQFQRNPRVKTSYHFTCKECASWKSVTKSFRKLSTGGVQKRLDNHLVT